MKTEELKIIVRDKYQEIASQSKTQNQSSCCGSSDCCDDMDYTIFSDDYTKLKGYVPDADLALGCGLPTEYAGCVSGALQKVDYLKIVEDQGFTDLSIQKEKPIVIPENILKNYLSSDEIEHARRGKFGVFSITLSASKPDFT